MDRDLHFLNMTARLAMRGHGGAEPNPLVGCVVVSPSGEIVGWGYHRTFGGPHAEIVALQRAGSRAKGATLYCTLEPCDHTGKTPPCTHAIIDARIARVVIARRDPNPLAARGLARLEAGGIATELNDDCDHAIAVSDPFVHRVRSGLPWMIVKWAQTIDGKIATRTGESKWISNDASRTLVHRERGRVDVILTGIGTVKCDDPLLTARSGTPRRIARRVVIDPNLETPIAAKLVETTRIAPTTIICAEDALTSRSDHADQLRARDVDIIALPSTVQDGKWLPLNLALRELVTRYDATTVLVESGTGLMSRLFQDTLVNEAWVFIAPMMLGDEQARNAFSGITVSQLTDGTRLTLRSLRRRGGDVIARYAVR